MKLCLDEVGCKKGGKFPCL